MSDPSEVRAKKVAEMFRQRLLAAIAKQDEALSAAYDKLAEDIRRELRATEFSIKDVREVVERNFKATLPARMLHIEQAIITAAREARYMPQQTFDVVFGEEATLEEALPLGRRSQARPKHLRRLPPVSEDE